MTVLWEAADRVCGKRLKARIPMLVDARERHGHLDLDPAVKTKVLQVSAATIDRVLANARLHIDGQRKRRKGVAASAVLGPRRPWHSCTRHRGCTSTSSSPRSLGSKTRDGARVHKVYLAPATPCERLLAHSSVEPAIKEKPRAQFIRRDPVRLLQVIRLAQQTLSDFAAHGVHNDATIAGASEVSVFLASLSLAWKDGEARPTHRKQPKAKHWWRNRPDPFADAWPVVEGWLIAEPTVQASILMDRLAEMIPDAYAAKAQLRTLQRRAKAWRSERVKEMVLGSLGKSKAVPVEA